MKTAVGIHTRFAGQIRWTLVLSMAVIPFRTGSEQVDGDVLK